MEPHTPKTRAGLKPAPTDNGEVKNVRRQTGGVSLLTLAILLLLLGGTLALGLNYFRASLPSTEASREREALLWADKAIIGFASTYHRLPCPAAAPNGAEDCALAKGWLPSTLDRDVSAFEPGRLPMRYMVYRDPSLLDGAETHHDLAIGEAGATNEAGEILFDSDGRLRPYNAFEPAGWDHDARPDPTAIKDADPHSGRYTGRIQEQVEVKDSFGLVTGVEDVDVVFNARNGLDMCETLRLVSVKQAGPGVDTTLAHYTRGGAAAANVAYGLALPGRFDASGNNNLFDGVNAVAAPVMEAPDRGHDAGYDDYVFVRDVDSLMSAFGCRPVRYKTDPAVGYTQNIDGAGGMNGLISNLLETFVGVFTREAPKELKVNIDREGIAVPMLESVQSVALAYSIIEDVQGQYEDLQAAIEETIIFTSIQAAIAAAGVAISVLTLAADMVGVAKAAAIAAACLGLCFNEYVAIAAYLASAVVSAVSIAVNTAATGVLIGGAITAGVLAHRLDIENSERVSDALQRVCDEMNSSDINSAIADAKKDAAEKVEEARQGMLGAEKNWNAYYSATYTPAEPGDPPAFKFEQKVKDCNSILTRTGIDNNLVCRLGANGTYRPCSQQTITGADGNPANADSYCPGATYQRCFASGSPSVIDRYAPFVSNSIVNRYQARLDAKQALEDLEGEIKALDQKILDTDTTRGSVRDAITTAVNSYCANCPSAQNPGCVKTTCEANYRTTLTADYDAQNLQARADRTAKINQRAARQNTLANAEAAIRYAHTRAEDGGGGPPYTAPDATCPNPTTVRIYCDRPYWFNNPSCAPAYNAIIQTYADYKGYGPNCQWLDRSLTAYECDASAYETLWSLYEKKKEAYLAAKDAYESFPDAPVIDCAMEGGDGKVTIWTTGAAREVLRRVDKRSVLQ
jgi:hypothetical protein